MVRSALIVALREPQKLHEDTYNCIKVLALEWVSAVSDIEHKKEGNGQELYRR